MTGAQWVVQALQAQGVRIVFGYPGGAIMPIYDALYDSGIEHILCRHEQGVAMAAIGFARATRQIGVCIATSGPGATNLITGLADAMLDSVPIIAITGQVSSELIGTDAFQEIDVLGLSLACTKHSFLVQSLDDLPIFITRAFAIAKAGRPGPVLIDIPKDIQLVRAKFNTYSLPIKKKTEYPYVELQQARELLKKSTKPILYVGGGVGIANAVKEFRKFAKTTGIPTVVTLKGIGTPDIEDIFYLGMLGMHGTKTANLAVQRCDLLIAVGARFDDRVTGKINTFAPYAKVIHIDIDQAEINKLRYANVGLCGDLNKILPDLHQKLEINSWHKEVKTLQKQNNCLYKNAEEKIFAPMFLKKLSDRKPNNAIVTTDVGQHQMWVAQYMSFNCPENFITSSGLGSMGFGLPAAVGAQVARPHDMVICISGDGSFMMNIQELGTIKRKQLPIKIVLLDNKRLGMVRQWQELFFDERYSETNLSDNPDFIMIARAFGILGQRITHKCHINTALDALLNSKESYMLHVDINELENVWPLVPPGASNAQMMEKIL